MGHPLRIVAADDDLDMVEFYREALERLGHQAAVVDGGRRLVEACLSVRPDLVITDIDMPDLGGIEAVGTVWKERPVPVILATGCDPAEVRGIAPSGNSLLVLRKPVTLTDLERAIASAVPDP
jgi:CheY-like chemotaxis protein